MEDNKSNAQSGEDAVEKLIELFSDKNTALLSACEATMRATYPSLPKDWKPRKAECITGPQTSKTDLWVKFDGAPATLAIAVLSADGGGSNHIERHPVDYYVKDLSFSAELIRILKLFTGTTKPCEDNASEYSSNAELSKGYAYFRDLNKDNQKKLLHMLLPHRETFVDKALLGRGEDIYKSKKIIGKDRVELFAFLDRKKPAGSEWSFLAPADVTKAICSHGVKPAERGDRQILLGYGLTLKRSNSTRYKGDTSMKDHLQLQINPRKILNESTDWINFHSLSSKIAFELVTEKTSVQSDAAHRGLNAELALIEKINARNKECTWIVEECCGAEGYGNFKAKKPGDQEKPDVLLYNETEDTFITQGISIKTYKPDVSFGHASRGTVETYTADLGIPNFVAETLRAFAVEDGDGNRTMLNKALPTSQQQLLDFFTKYQRQIVSHVLRGKAYKELKADWMLFHEAKDDQWVNSIGDYNFWYLYPMAKIIDFCCSEPPSLTKAGNLVLGPGLKLQRKGGDGGAKTANDLQFKINPKLIHEALKK